MFTPNTQRIADAVEARFDVRTGFWLCRRIVGTFTWSQHAWSEGNYEGNAVDIFGSVKTLDQVYYYVHSEFSEIAKTVLWRVKNHFDHVHVDTWPTGFGLPPCAGGALRVRHRDGSIGRTFGVPIPEPQPEEIELFVSEDGKNGPNRGPYVEYWQRIMARITGFKPQAWGVFGPDTTAELNRLTGPGNNIGPGEAATLLGLLGG